MSSGQRHFANTKTAAPLSRIMAAEYLGVSPRTFDRIKREKNLPFIRLRRRKSYLKRDLDALLNESREIEEVEVQ